MTSVKRRASFTLIELLVVVAIILILLGLSLKVMSLVNRKASMAKTVGILEEVKNALGAYYSTYGSYPPVSSVGYEYEGTPPSALPAIPPDMHYRTGLVYFIFSGAHHMHGDAPWQHYLDGLNADATPYYSNWVDRIAWVYWTNNSRTILDAWGQEIVYSSTGDYQRYTLYSHGAGTGTVDDIGFEIGEEGR